jgi:hypothetical protein
MDLGIPVRKPWEEDPKWFGDFDFGKPSWRKENLIFNLAIGYPF